MRVVAKIFPDFQFIWLAEETKKNLPLELDFVHEGRNCEKVADLFKHYKYLKVDNSIKTKNMFIVSFSLY